MDEKKPVADWTLAECKDLCEKQTDCTGCPLAGKLCGEYGLEAPYKWSIGG